MPNRILVVDDEEMVRELTRVLLAQLGYEAVMAGGGAEGIAVYERQGDELEMVLLDLTMPKMNGAETLARLRKLSPDVKVLLASGFDEPVELTDEDDRVGFIQKPFTLEALRDKMNELIDRGEDA